MLLIIPKNQKSADLIHRRDYATAWRTNDSWFGYQQE
jgi:hypothetical protein